LRLVRVLINVVESRRPRRTPGAAPDLQQIGRSAREADGMDRRRFLTGAAGVAAATAGLASPAISQRIAARTLRFVPQADLANFDPIWNTQYVVRNGAALIWDMLYGVDDQLQPRRQMVEAEEISADGLTWTFRLRPGLKFHDGEPCSPTTSWRASPAGRRAITWG
jgi:Bacterial extracellular solute-binding proteins, family 5 Middle